MIVDQCSGDSGEMVAMAGGEILIEVAAGMVPVILMADDSDIDGRVVRVGGMAAVKKENMWLTCQH